MFNAPSLTQSPSYFPICLKLPSVIFIIGKTVDMVAFWMLIWKNLETAHGCESEAGGVRRDSEGWGRGAIGRDGDSETRSRPGGGQPEFQLCCSLGMDLSSSCDHRARGERLAFQITKA